MAETPATRSLFASDESTRRSCVVKAMKRVYTNDLDALEALIVEGLPPLEMQLAAWVLVQRVRNLSLGQGHRRVCSDCGVDEDWLMKDGSWICHHCGAVS